MFENVPEFDALASAMKQSPRPLALLGAGTSVDSGYPDWTGLLAKLESRAKGKIGLKYQTFLRNLNDPAWQAEEYQRLIGEKPFNSLIASEFAPKGKVGAILQAIVDLRFRHILTTNYDSCIEQAFESKNAPLQVTDWTEDQNMRRFFLDLSRAEVTPHLVYLHGRYFEPANVVLTESSYANRYVRTDDANRKLFAILITQPVVFIGFSVNDPDLNHLMREVNARLGVGTPQHFALMGYRVDEQRQLIQNRFEGKYGIQPVFYRIKRNADGTENHKNLLVLLDELHRRVYGVSASVTRRTEELIDTSGPGGVTTDEDEKTKLHKPEAAAAQPLDPLDQQKGRWGGEAENNHRRLRVGNLEDLREYNVCNFELIVESTNEAAVPLAGDVVFYLHQTFHPDRIVEKAENGRAILEINAYGAFTVGVEADAGATKLELDLAHLDAFPQWFRER